MAAQLSTSEDCFSLKDKDGSESINFWIESQTPELYLLADKKVNLAHPTPLDPVLVS